MKVERKAWMQRTGDITVMSLGVVAAVVLLSSCGQEQKSSGSVAQSSATVQSPTVGEPEIATVASGTLPSSIVPAVSQGSTSNVTGEGLPPEIALADLDTLVTPGQPIEITVYGTPDVTEMSLWDGSGDRQAMVHDAEHDTWSAKYRVPIRSKVDRIGLSVTAKNETHRWRRVWVFLKIQKPDVAAENVEEGC